MVDENEYAVDVLMLLTADDDEVELVEADDENELDDQLKFVTQQTEVIEYIVQHEVVVVLLVMVIVYIDLHLVEHSVLFANLYYKVY